MRWLIWFIYILFRNLTPAPIVPFNDNSSHTLLNGTHDTTDSNDLNWHNIFFIKRESFVRYLQLVIAVYGLFETFFYFFLTYNVSFILVRPIYYVKFNIAIKKKFSDQIKSVMAHVITI